MSDLPNTQLDSTGEITVEPDSPHFAAVLRDKVNSLIRFAQRQQGVMKKAERDRLERDTAGHDDEKPDSGDTTDDALRRILSPLMVHSDGPDVVSFDGRIAIAGNRKQADPAMVPLIPLSDDTPQPIAEGAGAAGTSEEAQRADHVHAFDGGKNPLWLLFQTVAAITTNGAQGVAFTVGSDLDGGLPVAAVVPAGTITEMIAWMESVAAGGIGDPDAGTLTITTEINGVDKADPVVVLENGTAKAIDTASLAVSSLDVLRVEGVTDAAFDITSHSPDGVRVYALVKIEET